MYQQLGIASQTIKALVFSSTSSIAVLPSASTTFPITSSVMISCSTATFFVSMFTSFTSRSWSFRLRWSMVSSSQRPVFCVRYLFFWLFFFVLNFRLVLFFCTSSRWWRDGTSPPRQWFANHLITPLFSPCSCMAFASNRGSRSNPRQSSAQTSEGPDLPGSIHHQVTCQQSSSTAIPGTTQLTSYEFPARTPHAPRIPFSSCSSLTLVATTSWGHNTKHSSKVTTRPQHLFHWPQPKFQAEYLCVQGCQQISPIGVISLYHIYIFFDVVYKTPSSKGHRESIWGWSQCEGLEFRWAETICQEPMFRLKIKTTKRISIAQNSKKKRYQSMH